jgi:hypothetical protein
VDGHVRGVLGKIAVTVSQQERYGHLERVHE